MAHRSRRSGVEHAIRWSAWLLLPLAASAAIGWVFAQAAELRSIAEAVRRNQLALRNYDWQSRMEVTVDGEVRELTLVEATYDGKGQLVRTPLPVRDSSVVKSIRRKRKAMKLSEGLKNLIRLYAELSPVRMQTILTRANVRPAKEDGETTTRVQVRSVIHQGDSLDAWVDSATRRPIRFEVFTSLEGEPVHLVTEFDELEGGPSYPARTTVKTELKKKKIVIVTENFDYVPQGG